MSFFFVVCEEIEKLCQKFPHEFCVVSLFYTNIHNTFSDIPLRSTRGAPLIHSINFHAFFYYVETERGGKCAPIYQLNKFSASKSKKQKQNKNSILLNFKDFEGEFLQNKHKVQINQECKTTEEKIDTNGYWKLFFGDIIQKQRRKIIL